MNYLDGIATGVEEGVFVKEIVRDNLDTVIKESVHDFIEGGLGVFNIDKAAFRDLKKIAKEFSENAEKAHKAVS